MIKTRIRVLGTALVLALAASAASAQEAQRLSVDAAVDLALKNNLGLQSSLIDAAGKKRKVDTAWNVFVPTVDIMGTLARFNDKPEGMSFPLPPPIGPISLPASPQWSLSASLSAELRLNFAVFEGIKNLKMDYQAGLLSYEKAKAQLERDVRKSYYQILLLKENIALMEENLAAAQRRVALARDNYRAGLAPELTVLQAQVAAENLKPTIAELNNALESSMAAFAINLGFPYGTRLDLSDLAPPDFVELDLADLIKKGSSGYPDAQEIRQRILLAESGRKAKAYMNNSPSLILKWNADPTFQGDPWKDSWTMDDGWKQRSGMFSATIRYVLNGLLPFSSEAQGIADIDDGIKQQNILLASTVRRAEVEIYTTVLKLEKSRKSVEALRLNVDLAERAYRLTEESYRAGIKDLLEVQNSELELRKAQLEVVKEKFNYMTGLLDLEYAAGVPFGTLTRR